MEEGENGESMRNEKEESLINEKETNHIGTIVVWNEKSSFVEHLIC